MIVSMRALTIKAESLFWLDVEMCYSEDPEYKRTQKNTKKGKTEKTSAPWFLHRLLTQGLERRRFGLLNQQLVMRLPQSQSKHSHPALERRKPTRRQQRQRSLHFACFRFSPLHVLKMRASSDRVWNPRRDQTFSTYPQAPTCAHETRSRPPLSSLLAKCLKTESIKEEKHRKKPKRALKNLVKLPGGKDTSIRMTAFILQLRHFSPATLRSIVFSMIAWFKNYLRLKDSYI